MKPPKLSLAICNTPSITPVPAVIRTRKTCFSYHRINLLCFSVMVLQSLQTRKSPVTVSCSAGLCKGRYQIGIKTD